MVKTARIIALAALLLVGSASTITAAHADVTSCYDNPLSGRGEPVCTTQPGPPPPPDWMKPKPLGPPPLAGDSPWDGHSPLTYPASKTHAAPAPINQQPATPVQRYNVPADPAPTYNAPEPVYVQPAVPAKEAPAAPASVINEATAAPESTRVKPTPAATPTEAPSTSVTAIAATRSIEPSAVPSADAQSLDVQAASSSSNVTPVLVAVALVVAGAVALVVFLHFGPRVSGVRGIARNLFRR